MNKVFANEQYIISNKRIIEAYFTEAEIAPNALRKVLDRICALLVSILSVLTSARAVALFKTAAVVGCLIGFVGLIGAMERGSLSLLGGLLLSVPVIGIEYLTLKSYCKKSRR